MNCREALNRLKRSADPRNVEGMARFGINPKNTLGVSIPELRKIAKQCGKNHSLSRELWKSGIHEARILACFIDEPREVTEKQLEEWVREFDSWDVCDQCCSALFDKTEFAYAKALEWTKRKEEFVKRAGFVLMACLAVHDKKADDEKFLEFLLAIKRGASDERNFVKKAVNWALRQIGKRNAGLNKVAIKTAEEIQKTYSKSKSAAWVAADALRELKSGAVRKRICQKTRAKIRA